MEPTTDIPADFFDNADEFSHPFFARFPQRSAPTPLQLSPTVSKTYQFPAFYGDVTCAMAIFLCNYQKAKSLLPHPSMNPVKMTRGRAVVIFSCYEYKNVYQIRPYNEIAMTIPIMVGGGFSPPVLPLIKDFKQKGYYVFSMPVTSLENQIRGEKIWGLPKLVEDIDIQVEAGSCRTIAKDENGIPYFDLTVPTSGKAKPFNEKGFLYSVNAGKLLKSQTNFAGNFKLNTQYKLLWQKGVPATQPALVMGDSPRAKVLKELELEESAFQFRYARTMNSCFDLPISQD